MPGCCYGFIACLLLVSIFPAVAEDRESGRDFPEAHFARSAIVYGDGEPRGSGFYVNGTKSCFFVTAKHILFDMDKGDRLRFASVTLRAPARKQSGDVPSILRVDVAKLHAKGRVLMVPGRDVAVVPIGRFVKQKVAGLSSDVSPGYWLKPLRQVTLLQKPTSGMVGANMNLLVRFADVLRGNRAFIIGYPSDLAFLEMEEPTIASGVIAAFHNKRGLIILDIATFGGFSGSPVVQLSNAGALGLRHQIVGVLARVHNYVPPPAIWIRSPDGGFNVTEIPLNDSFTSASTVVMPIQFSIAEPVDTVLDLIEAYEKAIDAPPIP